jgi:hypothetical protein
MFLKELLFSQHKSWIFFFSRVMLLRIKKLLILHIKSKPKKSLTLFKQKLHILLSVKTLFKFNIKMMISQHLFLHWRKSKNFQRNTCLKDTYTCFLLVCVLFLSQKKKLITFEIKKTKAPSKNFLYLFDRVILMVKNQNVIWNLCVLWQTSSKQSNTLSKQYFEIEWN